LKRRLPQAPGRDAARQPRHRIDFIEQMGCPGTATPRSRTSERTWRRMADLTPRPIQPSVRPAPGRTAGAAATCDLDPPHLAARQFAHYVAARSVSSISCSAASASSCLAAADVQGNVIQQIFHDGEVEIERARLKHHAEQTQCLPGSRDAMAKHVVELTRVVEPRSAEQRGLARH
jgi:hypothetical protein